MNAGSSSKVHSILQFTFMIWSKSWSNISHGNKSLIDYTGKKTNRAQGEVITIIMWFIREKPVSRYAGAHIEEINHSSQASWKLFIYIYILSFSTLNPIHVDTCCKNTIQINEIKNPLTATQTKSKENKWDHNRSNKRGNQNMQL